MPGERSKRWERRADERPAELTAAALRLFSERGFAATRLEDVAAAAGVSKATVYLYFDNKERLFEAVVRAAVTPSLEHAAALVDAFDGPTPSLVRTLVALFEGALDGPFPAIAKLIIAESGNFPELAQLWVDLALGRALALVQKVIQRGVDRGEFRQVDPALRRTLRRPRDLEPGLRQAREATGGAPRHHHRACGESLARPRAGGWRRERRAMKRARKVGVVVLALGALAGLLLYLFQSGKLGAARKPENLLTL
jgi:AcrR family transcriptional regulator